MKKHKVYLQELSAEFSEADYSKFYEVVMRRIENGELVPMKSAKNNGRKPALPLCFWEYEKEADYTELYEELKYRYHPRINTFYYREHPECYERDREKYFQREGGLELCKRVAITPETLAFYETSEPLSYYSCSKQTPQNILIIENKDTFFDIRRYMNSGNDRIMGREFGTVIYGAGKGIWKTFEDYVNGAERYFLGKNALFYFGDLDFEGILIFEHLIEQKQYRESGIHIFKEAYEKMLDKAWQLGFSRLPDMKEKQNANIGTSFLSAFDAERRHQIRELLDMGKYIPQEILNEHDW